jgi:hypothetical protein
VAQRRPAGLRLRGVHRRIDQLVESLGLRISRSEVSCICRGLDEQVQAFLERPLEGDYPYSFSAIVVLLPIVRLRVTDDHGHRGGRNYVSSGAVLHHAMGRHPPASHFLRSSGRHLDLSHLGLPHFRRRANHGFQVTSAFASLVARLPNEQKVAICGLEDPQFAKKT